MNKGEALLVTHVPARVDLASWRSSTALIFADSAAADALMVRQGSSVLRILDAFVAAPSVVEANAVGASPIATGTVRYVTDGDTFRLTSDERIRIAETAAAEMHRNPAHCRLELVRGATAGARLTAIVGSHSIQFVRVRRSYQA